MNQMKTITVDHGYRYLWQIMPKMQNVEQQQKPILLLRIPMDLHLNSVAKALLHPQIQHFHLRDDSRIGLVRV